MRTGAHKPSTRNILSSITASFWFLSMLCVESGVDFKLGIWRMPCRLTVKVSWDYQNIVYRKVINRICFTIAILRRSCIFDNNSDTISHSL